MLVLVLRLAGDTKAEIGSILGRCGFPAIYNFGDSNSDTGAISAAAREVLPPNGEIFFSETVRKIL